LVNSIIALRPYRILAPLVLAVIPVQSPSQSTAPTASRADDTQNGITIFGRFGGLPSDLIYLDSTSGKKQTGQANVNGTALKNMLIPFPPLAEQRRLVTKVDELMALCAQLEASLTTAGDTRHCLLETLLAEALSPSFTIDRAAAE
jgi:hypothetical protein